VKPLIGAFGFSQQRLLAASAPAGDCPAELEKAVKAIRELNIPEIPPYSSTM